MSVFYKILYRVGFTPWEEGLVQRPVAEQTSAMFDREQVGRQPLYGRALDLTCYCYCRQTEYLTRQMHTDSKKRRFALLFAAGDLQRWTTRE